MSQQEIDRFFQYLKETPGEMDKAKAMMIDQVMALATAKGFRFDKEELEARQALVHLFWGT